MNAPKEIELATGKAEVFDSETIKGTFYLAGIYSVTEFPTTKYTRSDIVEALVKACEPIKNIMSNYDRFSKPKTPYEELTAGMQFIPISENCLRAIATALKALGE